MTRGQWPRKTAFFTTLVSNTEFSEVFFSPLPNDDEFQAPKLQEIQEMARYGDIY